MKGGKSKKQSDKKLSAMRPRFPRMAIPYPMDPFRIFLTEYWKKYTRENPVRTQGYYRRWNEAAEREWKNMTIEERGPYVKRFEENLKEFKQYSEGIFAPKFKEYAVALEEYEKMRKEAAADEGEYYTLSESGEDDDDAESEEESSYERGSDYEDYIKAKEAVSKEFKEAVSKEYKRLRKQRAADKEEEEEKKAPGKERKAAETEECEDMVANKKARLEEDEDDEGTMAKKRKEARKERKEARKKRKEAAIEANPKSV